MLGQSIPEFVIVLPVFLLILLVGLDFGRVFLGWVSLNNSARVAANFAAQNPNAWDTARPDASAQAEYQRLIQNDAGAINCTLPSPVPDPSFPGGNAIGEPAQVGITCNFQILTPLVSRIVGGSVPVSASAAFPIRNGVIEGIPVQTAVPTGTPSGTPTPTPAPTPTPTGTPSPTPTPTCIVPSFVGTNTAQAQSKWATAGFTNSVSFDPQVPPNGNITSQSLSGTQPCNSAITLTH